MLRLFKRWPGATEISAAAQTLGRAGAAARIDAERAKRRAMTDALRAELFAKGRADMTPIDWGNL